MSDLLQKCTVCGALVDEEDLFCANCGTEAPEPLEATEREPTSQRRQATHHFECGGCGASMSFDAGAGKLRCPFCGAERLQQQATAKVMTADRAVPFTIGRQEAVTTMRQWLGRGVWRPGNLATAATVAEMAAVYVPYWVFQAQTHTHWTADSSRTPLGARGDWYPLTGEHRGSYSGMLVGASGALTPSETSAICPFDLSHGVGMDQVDTNAAVLEQFRVKRKYARPLARQGLQTAEAQACTQYVAGRCRNLKVNVRIEHLSSEPVLLPVWIMAYRYRDEVFRFLINGQTGQATGQAPISWAKIAAAVAIALVLSLAVLIFGLMSS